MNSCRKSEKIQKLQIRNLQEIAGSVRFGSVPAQAGSGSAGSGYKPMFFRVRMFWVNFRADVFFWYVSFGGFSGTMFFFGPESQTLTIAETMPIV